MKSKSLAVANKKHVSRNATRCTYTIKKLGNEMRRLLVACALIMTVVSTASAEMNLNICEVKTRGIVKGMPCVLQMHREAAAGLLADGWTESAAAVRETAMRFEVIADKRAHEEITEEEALQQFRKTVDLHQQHYPEVAKQEEANYRQRVKAELWRRSMSQGLNNLSRTMQLQTLMSPTCTRYGFC